MSRLFTIVACMAVVTGASAQTLLTANFEHGMPGGWQVASGNWQVVAEPGHPDNHVLQAIGAGTIRFGKPDWRNYRLTARVRVASSTAEGFHLKLGVRAAGGNVYWLNVRNTGPFLIRHAGPQDFTPLAPVGGFETAVGGWYECAIECAGSVLTATVTNPADAAESGDARVIDDKLSSGQCELSVVAYGGAITALFDDITVTEVSPPPAVAAGNMLRTIESPQMQIALDEATGALQFTDRRSGAVWKQATAGVQLVLPVGIKVNANTLTYRLAVASGPIEVTVRVDGAEALITLTPAGKGRPVDLPYPLPQLPNVGDELVLPADEGVLLPATDVDRPGFIGTYHYGQFGIIMPWFGIQRGAAGIMALAETGDDFRLQVQRAAAGGTAVASPGIVWLPSRDDLRYPRRLRICLFDSGGYVAMARRYRKWLQDTGAFRTIADKARKIPAVAKLIGAVDVYDYSRDTKLLQWMIDNHIPHAVYSCNGPRERIAMANAAGYVTSRYDIYTDIAGPELLAIWGPAKSDFDCRRIGYPDECLIRRDGKPSPGFAYPVGAKGGVDSAGKAGRRIPCFTRCSATKLAWMKRIVPDQVKELGYTARFIDVETAAGLSECYSDKHPETRTEDRENRLALFDYLRSLGLVCSSEGGADWAAAHLDYQEGSLTLNHFGGLPGVYVGTKPFRLTDDYIKSQLDPAIRVPLHELVYHDSTWMTWRWNHTPNRWEQREYWDDWDLIHILYGAMPIYVVDGRDLPTQGARLLQSMRNIDGVLEKVGGCDMVSHRFLTNDCMVQETEFDGGLRVVVNFSAYKSFTLPGGTILAPKGFRLQ